MTTLPPSGSQYDKLLSGFFSHLDETEKSAIWGSFLSQHGLSPTIPDSGPDSKVSEFMGHIETTYADMQTELLSSDEIRRRALMFTLIDYIIMLMGTIEDTLTVEAKLMPFYGKWREQYSDMMKKIPMYESEERYNIDKTYWQDGGTGELREPIEDIHLLPSLRGNSASDIATIENFSLGYADLTVDDIAAYMAQIESGPAGNLDLTTTQKTLDVSHLFAAPGNPFNFDIKLNYNLRMRCHKENGTAQVEFMIQWGFESDSSISDYETDVGITMLSFKTSTSNIDNKDTWKNLLLDTFKTGDTGNTSFLKLIPDSDGENPSYTHAQIEFDRSIYPNLNLPHNPAIIQNPAPTFHIETNFGIDKPFAVWPYHAADQSDEDQLDKQKVASFHMQQRAAKSQLMLQYLEAIRSKSEILDDYREKVSSNFQSASQSRKAFTGLLASMISQMRNIVEGLFRS